jgi:hypothetical protein
MAMPRTFALIAAVATAVAVAVPTAAAEGQPTGTHSVEAAVATTQMLDARERAFEVKQVTSTPNWLERFAAAHSVREPVVDDRFRIDPTADSAPVATSSGRELEWPQFGIGVAFLIALAIGAYLVVRPRWRQLAH